MRSNTVTFWFFALLLSLSTQAMGAVFDIHTRHNNVLQHGNDTTSPVHQRHIIEQAVTHLIGNNTLDVTIYTPPHDEYSSGFAEQLNEHDCQHCCHCHHSVQHLYLPALMTSLTVFAHRDSITGFDTPPKTGYWRDLLRPPIA